VIFMDGLCVLALCVIALHAGCLHEASQTCGNGSVCPPGLLCVDTEDTAHDKVCAVATCGNGLPDDSELCDDGNNRSGDGCPADCSQPCGDGVRDPDEVCDDGNAVDGDGCSSDCRSIDGIFSVSPPMVMFSVTEGDDPPPPVDVAVRLQFRGDRVLAGYVDGVPQPSWLSIEDGPVTATTADFRLRALDTLSVGLRSTTVRLAISHETSTGLDTFDLPVAFNVMRSDLAIEAMPATLAFVARADDPVPPSSPVTVVSNGSEVTVVSAPSWVTVTPGPATEPASFTVSANSTSFPGGTNLSGDIVFGTARRALERRISVHATYNIVTRAMTVHVPADRPTIQAAINAAVHGDTIIVADGTYTENIDFKGKAITLRSANGPATTIIDGGDTSCVVKFATGEVSAAVLTGFTIRHGRASPTGCGIEGAGILVDRASPTIDGNIISGNRGCDGIGIGVGFGSPIIQNNVITQNQRTTCSGGLGGGGISIRGASTAEIIGNLITNNDAGDGGGGGISLFAVGITIIRGNLISGNVATTVGGAISMLNQSPVVITNNIITQNSAPRGAGIAASVSSGSLGPRMINNTIARNTSTGDGSELYLDGFLALTQIWNNVLFGASAHAAVACITSRPPVFRFNDGFNTAGPAYAGSCANVTGVDGNISVDPIFVSASDFHLDATSPVIDAGSNTAPSRPATDFAGSPRVLDGNGDGVFTVDMGAFEFISAPSFAQSSCHRGAYHVGPCGTRP
jgi:cysteine-rich repeat protein